MKTLSFIASMAIFAVLCTGCGPSCRTTVATAADAAGTLTVLRPETHAFTSTKEEKSFGLDMDGTLRLAAGPIGELLIEIRGVDAVKNYSLKDLNTTVCWTATTPLTCDKTAEGTLSITAYSKETVKEGDGIYYTYTLTGSLKLNQTTNAIATGTVDFDFKSKRSETSCSLNF